MHLPSVCDVRVCVYLCVHVIFMTLNLSFLDIANEITWGSLLPPCVTADGCREEWNNPVL